MVQGRTARDPLMVEIFAGLAEEDVTIVRAAAHVLAAVPVPRVMDPKDALSSLESKVVYRSLNVAVIAMVEFLAWRRTIL